MKPEKTRKKFMQYLRLFSEGMYLAALSIITAYAFLRTTTVPLPWNTGDSGIAFFNELTADIPLHMEYLLLGITALRCLVSKKHILRNFLLSAGICGIVGYAVSISHYGNLLLLTLLLLAARDIPFDRIMKVYTVTVGILLVMTVGAALGGLIENLQFGKKRKMAFGIVYSTDFAAHVFFLMLCIWYLRGKKTSYPAAVFTGILGLGVYWWSDARCSAGCLLLLSALMAACRFFRTRCPEKGEKICRNPVLCTLLALSFPIASACMLAASLVYQESIVWMRGLDKLLSGRLYYGKHALSICGFHLWGKQIRMNGHWADGQVTDNYFYLDSSYMQMALMFGLVISALALLAFLHIGYKAVQRKQWIFLWILALMALHGLIEQRIWSLSYCPFILAVFAQLGKSREVETVG